MQANDRFRNLTGWAARCSAAGCLALSLMGILWALQVHRLAGFAVFPEQYLAAFLSIAAAVAFLIARPARGTSDRVPWYDAAGALASLAFGLYVVLHFPRMAYSLSIVTWDKLLFGTLALLVVLEATRRLLGPVLVILAVVLCLYTRFGYLLPGLLYSRGVSWERLVIYLPLDSNGLFGIALAVTATMVASFIVFGRALQIVGGGDFFTDLSLALMGRYRGGPAKVAVLSSTLFGTMSGSVISNVVVSGSLTIPLMKRHGYTPQFASATEAAASTGGQIMPPVMGIAAFIIAENLGVPYGEVALAALIPALLYYAALFVQVDLEARRLGLPAMPAADCPRLWPVLKRGSLFFLPLAILVYTLVIAHWSPGKAGVAAALGALAAGLVLTPATRRLSLLVELLRDCGRMLVDITVVSALAGIVIGTLHLSGLGFTLSMVLAGLAEQGVLVLLVVTALVCVVFGMGMPTTVIYVMLAVMVAPALVQIGVKPIAAHLFIFYFGMLSMLTPPVCMASMTAASLGQAPFWTTAWMGVRLGIVAYIVPFFFVYHPALLLQDVGPGLVLDLAATAAGLCLVAVGAAGYLRRPVGPLGRLGFVVSGLCLAAPTTSEVTLVVTLAGLAGGVALLVPALLPGRGLPRTPQPSSAE